MRSCICALIYVSLPYKSNTHRFTNSFIGGSNKLCFFVNWNWIYTEKKIHYFTIKMIKFHYVNIHILITWPQLHIFWQTYYWDICILIYLHKHLDFDWTGRLRTCFDFYKTKYIKDIEFYWSFSYPRQMLLLIIKKQ